MKNKLFLNEMQIMNRRQFGFLGADAMLFV
jgi:hypothetical protein